jgi:hypothetical protein
MQIWAAIHPNEGSPFSSCKELHQLIDSIDDGNAPWQCLTLGHHNSAAADCPSWQNKTYEVWFRDPKVILNNMLSNPDFKDGFDYTPRLVFGEQHERIWSDFMTANWAWTQCVSCKSMTSQVVYLGCFLEYPL